MNNEWTYCKDRLPPPNFEVIVAVRRFDGKSFFTTTGYLTESEQYWDKVNGRIYAVDTYEIYAWMQLPSPPYPKL